MAFSDPNAYHWNQVYAGLVGQAAGYGVAAASKIVSGQDPMRVLMDHIVPFVVSAAAEVASAPVTFEAGMLTHNATIATYAAWASTAALDPVLFSMSSNSILQSSIRPLQESPSLPAFQVPLPVAPEIVTGPIRTVLASAPLAGAVGSSVSKLLSTHIQKNQRLSSAKMLESAFVALTRSAVIGHAVAAQGTTPKIAAGSAIAFDVLSAYYPKTASMTLALGSYAASIELGALGGGSDADKARRIGMLCLLALGIHGMSAYESSAE